jgi:uncharacterized protein YbbK (DUF523 family)/uncharacterized protein YbgA (DUF1722 family)
MTAAPATAPRKHAAMDSAHPKPRIGVSRCLLGDNVRMNGGHCRDRWILRVLEPAAEFIGVCPEVEYGLPTPRPPIRLALTEESLSSDDIHLVEPKSGDDLTVGMQAYSKIRAEELAGMGLHGFILKKDSPSCGVFRVKVYDKNGSPTRRGRGVFAEALCKRLPSLPVEEEGRLNDPALRESFLVRVHAFARWRAFVDDDGSIGGLQAFHARHKMMLLACNPGAYRNLGRLVAGHADDPDALPDRLAAYETGLMQALAKTVSRGRHINVLQHLLGFCKTDLAPAEKREIGRLLELYAKGALPRAAPLALVRYLLIKHEAAAWATEQVYFEPYGPTLFEDQTV